MAAQNGKELAKTYHICLTNLLGIMAKDTTLYPGLSILAAASQFDLPTASLIRIVS